MAARAEGKRKTPPAHADSPIASPTDIPDKLMFRIGEVSRIVGVEPYVLRYWETEFPQLSPKKSGSGHRMYRRKEVEQLLLIRQLLYDRQYTIKGARQYLKELSQRREDPLELPAPVPAPTVSRVWNPGALSERPAAPPPAVAISIDRLREELRSILMLLD